MCVASPGRLRSALDQLLRQQQLLIPGPKAPRTVYCPYFSTAEKMPSMRRPSFGRSRFYEPLTLCK